jgi:hypothetical protein
MYASTSKNSLTYYIKKQYREGYLAKHDEEED